MGNLGIAAAALKGCDPGLDLLEEVAMNCRIEPAQRLLGPGDVLVAGDAFADGVGVPKRDQRLQGGKAAGGHGIGVEAEFGRAGKKLAQSGAGLLREVPVRKCRHGGAFLGSKGWDGSGIEKGRAEKQNAPRKAGRSGRTRATVEFKGAPLERPRQAPR